MYKAYISHKNNVPLRERAERTEGGRVGRREGGWVRVRVRARGGRVGGWVGV
jgi:hypothetical protein